MDDKEKARVSALLFLASILFSLAAPQYAKVCDANPSGAMISIATGIPAFAFALAAVTAIIGAFIVIIFGKRF